MFVISEEIIQRDVRTTLTGCDDNGDAQTVEIGIDFKVPERERHVEIVQQLTDATGLHGALEKGDDRQIAIIAPLIAGLRNVKGCPEGALPDNDPDKFLNRFLRSPLTLNAVVRRYMRVLGGSEEKN